MQYLSQRLAFRPAPKRGGDPAEGTLPARQRDRVLDAAERLAAARGCAGTSIEAIVKAAGISTVTFYELFEGKEACFVAAFDRAVERATAELREAVSEDLSWPEQVGTGLRALLAMVEAWPVRARLCLVEAQTGGASLSASFEAMLDRIALKLREGRALDTAPPALPDTHEEAMAGALAWLVRERLERGGEVGELYPKLIEIVLSPYLGDD
jgi:AcrR family transcriptional regulator